MRFTGGGYSQGEAVDLFEVFGGEADEAVEEAVFGALPCDGLLSHFGKAGVVDADLCEGGREAELFLEVFPQAFDAFIFFDLPTGTPRERKAYMQFRKYLLHAGYDMLQYSVYVRIAGSRDDAQHMLGIITAPARQRAGACPHGDGKAVCCYADPSRKADHRRERGRLSGNAGLIEKNEVE